MFIKVNFSALDDKDDDEIIDTEVGIIETPDKIDN